MRNEALAELTNEELIEMAEALNSESASVLGAIALAPLLSLELAHRLKEKL